MSRFDYRDPGTDPSYCDGISEQAKTERCETCGDNVNAVDAIYNANGKYAFCSEICYQQYLASIYDGEPDGDAWSGGFAGNH